MVRRAQARLAAEYSLDAMRAQVLGVLHATLQAHRATSPSTA